ncbi:MAG: TRAP transporter substrate-binding protein [Pseudomonadota bacterium]
MTDETTKPVQSAPSQAEPKQSASAPLPSHQPPSTRRALLKHAAGVGAAIGTAGLVSACGSADDQGPGRSPAPARRQVKLKMVTTWLPGFPGLGTGAERFARRVNETSDGSIDIDVYAAGELVDALGAFDAVSQGKADLYHGGEYYWQGKSRAFNFFAALPFGMTAEEIAGWVYYGGGQALWDELSAKFNIKPLMAGNTGTQMGGWYNKEINQVADFAGLRIRMPGLGGEVMSKLGATPVTKAGSEIYVSMEQGNIDASEWVGPWNDLAFGFHRIAKYYYYPGFHEPGTALSVGFNKDVWEGLTKAQKAIMKAAA